MKKRKIGSIEILGYIGMIVWVAVTVLRRNHVSSSENYRFIIGILPNLGAAWAMTMFAKWVWVLVLKRNFNVKVHIVICISILLVALGSEIIHDVFMNSPFDVYDMITTTVAQTVMIIVPLLIKDRTLSNEA